MFPYIPNTEQDEKEMLEVLGIDSIDRLFDDIPAAIKLGRRLDLGSPLSETEVSKKIKSIANKNTSTEELVCFRGAGAYDHSVPSIVKHLISRSEFYTAYTPYQPEISQGTLQAVFEYQTMIANLTGLEVSNASMYDGASATAEAAMLAAANQKGDTVVISNTVHPQTREVVKTYMRFYGTKVVEVPSKDGVTDMDALKEAVNGDTVAVIVQNPNFFGIVEDCTGISDLAHENKALFIMNVDPISLGMLKTPGEYGADLAVGEGQVLGNGLNYGGPYLGFMAASTKQMRKMPGRIVGQTVDLDGKRAFTLTLQAREQHIRRDKATSNICSNQALNALAATIYLGALGTEGLFEVADASAKKAYYAFNKLIATGKFKPVYDQPFFREFVLETDMDVDALNAQLANKGFLGGYNLEKEYPSDKNRVLFCVTEKRTIEEIDCLVKAMEEISW
ncbi:MAG TPA: aminomethyl-transferring glycine dehydrogenase subunit GcvPA [Clostridiales bacterium UBA8960]|nr:aminomethyl-transferring glycine dehydrogenase subunit GcvPA [Clostridiales bacterium UBA8960]